MRKYLVMFLILCATAISLLLLLRPDPSVRFEADLLLLEPDEALRILRASESAIIRHDNLELLHARLSLADGDIETARRSYRRLLSRVGPSVGLLETLSGLEVVAGDLRMAADYLHRAHDMEPTPGRRERLGLWYRELRMQEAERGILQSVEPARLSPWEAWRLSHLLMAAGQVGAYEALLAARAGGQDADGLAFMRRLLEFLVESDRAAAAAQYVPTWLETGPDPGAVLETAAQSLIGRGAVDAAIAVARQGFAAAPQDGHRALPVFVKTGHGGVARILQTEWLAGRAALTPAEWDTLTFMAEATGDLRGLRAVLASDRVSHAPSPAVGRALLQFLRYQGPGAILPYRHLLGPDVQAAAPLVAAAWASWSGDREAAYGFLVKAGGLPLSEWDQEIWMSLAGGLRGSPFQRALLAGAVTDPALRKRLRDSVISPLPAVPAAE